MLADHDEQHRYGDATILEPIVEQQDEEISPSPSTRHFLDDEIEHFEALEREFASARHGIRVQFAPTTVLKSEPFFHLRASEDQITKHFYQNDFPRDEAPSPDSLEDETSPPRRSILKKLPLSRSPSPKKLLSLQSNELPFLAEMTGKGRNSSARCPVRSLFESTVNIFDSGGETRVRRRPSRLRYYIKPYRGEANLPAAKNSEQRSRSLTHAFARPATEHGSRKQHVSWSPVRAYIQQGREKPQRPATRKSTEKNPSLAAGRSSSNPCLPSASAPPSSLTPLSHFSEYEEKSSSTSLVSERPSKEHTQTMQRYDRLLEKMRTTDEQLRSLSRSWNSRETSLSSMKSSYAGEKTTKAGATDKPLISPMLLQMCLVILVLCNFLAVYFFNEIHFWWSEHTGHTGIVEQRDGPTTTYS